MALCMWYSFCRWRWPEVASLSIYTATTTRNWLSSWVWMLRRAPPSHLHVPEHLTKVHQLQIPQDPPLQTCRKEVRVVDSDVSENKPHLNLLRSIYELSSFPGTHKTFKPLDSSGLAPGVVYYLGHLFLRTSPDHHIIHLCDVFHVDYLLNSLGPRFSPGIRLFICTLITCTMGTFPPFHTV